MRPIVDKERWYFVDEAGDPAYYGKGKKFIVGSEGCSKTFSVGYLRVTDPQSIRDKLAEVRLRICSDKLLMPVPSLQKSLQSFHAKDDCTEVRYLVYTALQSIDFKAHIIVARKIDHPDHDRFAEDQDLFYDTLVGRLFGNQFHIAEENYIVFSRRGTKTRQHSLREAVQSAVRRFRKKYPHIPATAVSVDTSQPLQEPCLQAADYVLWSVQRAFEKREMRYFECLRDKVQLVWDLYDYAKFKGPRKENNIYSQSRNPFHIDKTSPLS